MALYREPLGEFSPALWPPEAEEMFQLLIAEMRGGTLTKERFQEWVPDPFNIDRPLVMPPLWHSLLRSKCIREVGFVVITTGYLESLAWLLKGQRVLEVGAGMGVFQGLMRERGIDWTSTDISPWMGSQAEAMGALEAMEHYKPDTVFFSWADLGNDLDDQIARLIPCVHVTEECTGAGGLCHPQGFRVLRRPRGFEDIPSWPGIRDHTDLTVPRGVSTPSRWRSRGRRR